jgi:hypothetical protein
MRYVYLLRAGKGRYKVGIAGSIINRVKALQTSNSERIEVVAAKQTPDAAAYERSLHKLLEDQRLNGGREWFSLSDDQAIELAILINESPSISMSEIDSLGELLNQSVQVQRQVGSKFENLLAQLQQDQTLHRYRESKLNKEENGADRKSEERGLKLQGKQAEEEALTKKALDVVRREGKASTSLLQLHLQIGYGRAARIINTLEREGYIGPADGSRPRVVLEDTEPVAA